MKIRVRHNFPAGLFLIAFIGAAFYLTDYFGGIFQVQRKADEERNARKESVSTCNLFSGRWVFDNTSYPLYEGGRCSFLTGEFACLMKSERKEGKHCSFVTGEFACVKYGRDDLKYQYWRWQPHDCDLPRFNGTALLEKIRGKRLVFVGDSLNRNQWTSMLCLIESSLHQFSNKSVIINGNMFIFQANEYNTTIEFYWSPLLVESNGDDPVRHRGKNRIIRITAIEKHARHWTDADILIFDAFVWWLRPTMTLLWGSFGSSDAIYKRVEMGPRLYEMALNTWSDWLEININRTKTKLFFMSISPFHNYNEIWDVQQHCYNETEPILKEGYRGRSTDHREMMHVAESIIRKLETRGLKIEYLNITRLSDYRRDAHPSVYRKFFRPLSEKELADPKSYADCLHWCLPGVPDVWNEILYTYIINSS